MNILFVASDNYAASGAFLSMVQLCAILKDKYHHNVHVVLQREGDGQKRLEEKGIPYHFIRTYNWVSRLSEYATVKNRLERTCKAALNCCQEKEYRKLFRELDVDIVHMNTSWTYLAAQVAHKMGIPYVWHIREFLEEDQKSRMWNREKAYKLIEQASCVIAISDSILRKYQQLIPNANLVKVYNGIDVQKFYVENHSLFSQDTAQLLIVGSISESKGQEQLIEACAAIYKKGFRNFHLKIVGTGKEEYVNHIKQKVASFGIDHMVTFCGYRTDAETFYRAADITFVCSKSEAFGRVTVEAMLSGALIIGADSAATVELVSDMKTGILYSSGDSESLAEKIVWALEHPDIARKIAKDGQSYMLQNMTAERNAQRVNEIYDQIRNQNAMEQ